MNIFDYLETNGFLPYNRVKDKYVTCERPRGGSISSMGHIYEIWIKKEVEEFNLETDDYLIFGLFERGFPPTWYNHKMKVKLKEHYYIDEENILYFKGSILSGSHIPQAYISRLIDKYGTEEFVNKTFKSEIFEI
jgi:hypothetical protein